MIKKNSDEHVMVCLSAAPSNKKIIMTGAQMSEIFGGRFTAIYVETNEPMTKEDRQRLKDHMKLAEKQGAFIETSYGDDVSAQIVEYAKIAKVTKIIIGRSNARKRYAWSKPTIVDRLLEAAPDIDIYIIPDTNRKSSYYARRIKRSLVRKVSVRDLLITGIIVGLATLIGFLFEHLGFISANIITVYILGMLLISVFARGWLCNLLGALGSVLAFNYFFTSPKFTFMVYNRGYPVTFLIMFFSSVLTGVLMSKIKQHSKETAKTSFRNKVLFETNQMLQMASSDQEVLSGTAKQLYILLNRTICIYTVEGEKIQRSIEYGQTTGNVTGDLEPDVGLKESARKLIRWTYEHNKRCGATTDVFPDAENLYLTIRSGGTVYGVVEISVGNEPLETFEQSMILSVLGECALALESMRNSREKEQIALLAKSEQLRADLLRSISHDLRTPLTSISGNANNLLYNYKKMDDELREQIFEDIYDDAMWLVNVVENLLAVTRFDNGQIKLNVTTELAEEIVTEAIRHVKNISKEHELIVETEDSFLLVEADSRLLVQVLINLIDNAVKYTPKGSKIIVRSAAVDGMAQFQIIDDGPGIAKEHQPYIFDMFYTANSGVADSRRSLGLGLSLCRSIVEAHQGTIRVADHEPHGCEFTIRLPMGKVKSHE